MEILFLSVGCAVLEEETGDPSLVENVCLLVGDPSRDESTRTVIFFPATLATHTHYVYCCSNNSLVPLSHFS